MEYKTRIEYLDIAKGIAMLCVILAHIPVPDIPNIINRLCFSFHMPIFFLISGYLFRKADMNTLIVRKSKQLLLPYLYTLLAIIFFSVCINKCMGNYSITAERNILEWIWAGFYGSGNTYGEPFWIKQIGAIWFLPAMFFSLILFDFCSERKSTILWIAAFIWLAGYIRPVLWLPFSAQASLLSLGYVYIGHELRKKDLLEKEFQSPIAIIGAFCLWIFYIICGGGHLYLVQGYFEKGIVFEVFFSSVASFCVLWTSYIISRKTRHLKRFFSFYGQHSLFILCAHLVELNTFRWDILVNSIEGIGLPHHIAILFMYCSKILWATAAFFIIEKVKKWRIWKKWKFQYKAQIQSVSVSDKGGSNYIHFIRASVLIFVILGHLPIENSIRTIIFSFHAPLLFMIMGCFYQEQKSLLPIYREGRNLLFSYIGFRYLFLIGCLWKDIFYYGGWGTNNILKEWLKSTIFGMSFSSSILTGVQGTGYIWIIICLLFTLILGTVIFQIRNEKIRSCVVFAVSAFGIYVGKRIAYLPFSFDVSMVCVSFLYAGYVLSSPEIKNKINNFKYLTLLMVLWMIQIKLGGIELATRSYPYGLFSIIGAISGCIIIIEAAQYLIKIDGINQVFDFIGRNYMIFWGSYYLTSLCNWEPVLAAYPIMTQFFVKLIISLSIGAFIIVFRDICYPKLCNPIFLEKAYLTVFMLYTIRLFCDTTLISIPWSITFFPMLRIIMIGIVLFKLIYSEKYRFRIILLGLLGASIFSLSFISTGYDFLFDLAILIIGAIDIPYKKILKIYFWCGITILSLAIAASLTGTVRDLVYKKNGIYRHSFGICYPTDFAAHCVYLILTGFVIFDKIPLIVSAGFMLLFFLFQYFYCVTECSEIVMLFSILGVAYVGIASWAQRKNSIVKKLTFLIDQCLTAFMAICAGLIIWMSFRYREGNELLQKIDVIISSRLRLAREAFTTYGIKLFGTPFNMVGGGGDTVWRQDYNFLDSSFCLILIRYGLAVLCAVLVIYFIVERKALRAGNRKLMVAFALISIHSMIEHHLLEIAYNPFILLAFSNMDLAEGWKKETIREERAKGRAEAVKEKQGWQQILHRKKNRIGYGLCGILLIFMAPGILQYGKTLVTLLGLYEPWRHRYVILVLILVAGAAAGLVKGIVDIFILCLEQKTEKKEQKTERNEHKTGGQEQKTEKREQNSEGAGRRTAIGWKGYLVAGCGACLILAVGVSEYVIGKRAGLYEESLAVGGKAFSALREGGLEDGRFYVDDIPELYRRRFGGISGRVLSADSAGAGSDSNTVVIARKDRDIKRLMEAGFWFGELSDREGIYTDSERAVEVLKENGIDMKDYYSVRKEIDLPGLAEHNGLSVTEAGGLLVEGSEKSLIYGSYDVLYKGLLRVEYRIHLLDTTISEGEVARVRLAYEWGKHVVKEQGLTRSDFDENGYCTAVMEERIPDAEGVECLLFANGDTRIEIESISYRKVGR